MEQKLRIVDRIIGRICPVSADGRGKLAGILQEFSLDKGELFIREKQVCRYIGYVDEGMVRQFYTKNGKDLTEHFTYEGAIFLCLESFFRQVPSYLQVEALEPARIFCLPHDPLMELIRELPEIHYLYSGILEKCLIISQQKADASRFETAHERYARLVAEHPEVIRRAPLGHIASYLGMTPETLSRVRAGLL